MDIIKLEIGIIGTGEYKTSITNLLGNFSLEELSSDKFKGFIHHCLEHLVDYGDDDLLFEDDIGEGYVFMTLSKYLQEGKITYGLESSYFQDLI